MAEQRLTKERLPTSEGVLTVGVLAVKELQERGFIALFVDKLGEVEFCPYLEICLDGLPEDQAIVDLVGRGYTDEQLAVYLRGRDARKVQDG